MDMTWFLITVAPPLVLIACVFIVFWWATAAKPPAFVIEELEAEFDKELNTEENIR